MHHVWTVMFRNISVSFSPYLSASYVLYSFTIIFVIVIIVIFIDKLYI